MPKPIPATTYLSAAKDHKIPSVCVVFGEEEFLKRQILLRLRREVFGNDPDEGEVSCTCWEGAKAELVDVLEELETVAMFGPGTRLVVVEDADPFVTRYRPHLEDYVGKPRTTGVLILVVKNFAANTRLYKLVAEKSVSIQCKAPTRANAATWLQKWATRAHRVELTPAAADMLVERVGLELGLLDQELAKLAVSLDATGRITPETVQRMVGTWRAKTAWDMLDASLAGNLKGALLQLDRLLLAGEHPVAILGQISATLRRLAAATSLVLHGERTGRRLTLPNALQQAGIKQFFLNKAQQQLRRLGRHRGRLLYRWLLEADLGLKGSSALPPRLVLERLLVRLARQE